MPERTYTTHDIAKFCDVYPSTAANWIREGKLKSYHTAGGHNRGSREDLLSFLSRLNIPIPPAQGIPSVLAVFKKRVSPGK